jgi:hypothetical protein
VRVMTVVLVMVICCVLARRTQPGPGSVSLMEGRVLATKIGRRTIQALG